MPSRNPVEGRLSDTTAMDRIAEFVAAAEGDVPGADLTQLVCDLLPLTGRRWATATTDLTGPHALYRRGSDELVLGPFPDRDPAVQAAAGRPDAATLYADIYPRDDPATG